MIPQAVAEYRKALEIEPEDPAALNQLGYAEAYAGDLARRYGRLRRYQALRPAEANPLDSLGDVNLMSGRLSEAESFYTEAAARPQVLSGAVDCSRPRWRG